MVAYLEHLQGPAVTVAVLRHRRGRGHLGTVLAGAVLLGHAAVTRVSTGGAGVVLAAPPSVEALLAAYCSRW